MKSLSVIELLLALVTGRRAFGSDRFGVSEPVSPALYLTEEDPPGLIAQRFRASLNGRDL